jgi:hypothetical protein
MRSGNEMTNSSTRTIEDRNRGRNRNTNRNRNWDEGGNETATGNEIWNAM